MKSFKSFLLLLFVGINFCHAQDTVISLSPAMFARNQDILIATLDGWRFRDGHDSTWANKDIDLTGWKKFKPADLNPKNANKNGQAEGWFRLHFKLDSSFGNMRLGLRFYCWAAIDLYIDGKFIQSFGNTGADGSPFQEFNPNERLPVLVDMAAGKEHMVAFHFVDRLSPFPPHLLKSQRLGSQLFIMLTGPAYYDIFSEYLETYEMLLTAWISVSAILFLLFLLLAFLNPRDKNLWLISIFTTLCTLFIFSSFLNFGHNISSTQRTLYDFFGRLCRQLSYFTIPLILINIFNRKLIWDFKIFMFISLIVSLSGFILPNNFQVVWYGTGMLGAVYYLVSKREIIKTASWKKVMGIVFIGLRAFLGITLLFLIISLLLPKLSEFLWSGMLIAICSYYIISSWKSIKGAQWAIVAGLILTVLWSMTGSIAESIYKSSFFPFNRLYGTGTLLSFPISLLVYVAMRFKEFINEVRENAKQVLQLSEEKKEQAINRQKILQEEVNRQTAEIRATLDDLKSTQHLLIQSEKMASLGELTAGIAHEIQNPLNFVNNFSEVSSELVDEMNSEIDKGNTEDAKLIAQDLKQNLEKINHHGKRAGDIVKSMLQHSRSSSGVKQPTNINVLADEYLRLAYHGLRAKDKSFNATMKTEFDETIGNINIVPQDIGRVVLNLINNAFYALSAKASATADGGYEPTVSVSTKKVADKVLISVKDNGNGIPQKVLDKIFQPFFTTKPTGQGTGLGLSLSYDIVKAHGGELKVETKEGEGSEFFIILPIV